MNPSVPVNSDYNGEALFGHRSDNSQSGIRKNVPQPDIVVNRYTFHMSFTQGETESVQQNICSNTVPNPSSDEEVPDYSDYFRVLAGESSGITRASQHQDAVSSNENAVQTVDSHLVSTKRHRMDHYFQDFCSAGGSGDILTLLHDILSACTSMTREPSASNGGNTSDVAAKYSTAFCCICYDNLPNALLPCRHLFCNECVLKSLSEDLPCALCMAPFTEWEIVHP